MKLLEKTEKENEKVINFLIEIEKEDKTIKKEIQVNAEFEVCPSCDGDGKHTTTRHVEAPGGGFTQSE